MENENTMAEVPNEGSCSDTGCSIMEPRVMLAYGENINFVLVDEEKEGFIVSEEDLVSRGLVISVGGEVKDICVGDTIYFDTCKMRIIKKNQDMDDINSVHSEHVFAYDTDSSNPEDEPEIVFELNEDA